MPLSQGHARPSRSPAGLTRWYRLCTTRVFQGDCHECVPGYAAHPPVSTPFFPWHRDASWMPGASSRPRGVRMNRLRVFRRAHTAHLGRGVGQEQWLRVGPSAKDAARTRMLAPLSQGVLHLVLTGLLAYGAVASRLGRCEQLLPYGKL